MASNPYVNKVQLGNQTVMDISDTTAEEGDVVSGKTFYKASGQRSTGTADYYSPSDPTVQSFESGDYIPIYRTMEHNTGKKKIERLSFLQSIRNFFNNIYAVFSGTETELRDTVGWTCKNLLEIPDTVVTTTTQYGITFTVTRDSLGHVTEIDVNGTSTGGASTLTLIDDLDAYLPSGYYTLSGCPANGSSSTYYMRIITSPASITYYDTGEGVNFGAGEYPAIVTLFIGIASGTTCNHLKFKPMIRKRDVNDSTFEVPHKSVKEELDARTFDMIPTTNDISTVALLDDGDDDYVVNAYTVKRYSNVECMSIFTTVAQGNDTVGAWNDTWKTDGVRTGWLWHSALYGILDDDEVEASMVFDVQSEETVSVYAYRVDDNVSQVINGVTVNGGAIAIKLNSKIQTAGGVKIGMNLKRQRTLVDNFSVIS